MNESIEMNEKRREGDTKRRKNIDKVVNKLIEMDGKINDFVVFVVL